MTYINSLCADVGTANCPCILASTGDCLVCSRLSGRDECDCRWSGVCIYNEYIQNGSIVREKRENRCAEILKRTWYGSDLLVIVFKVPKGFALRASRPGSFIFVNPVGSSEFSNVPVSVMKADADNGRISIAIKIISGKTKAVAEEKTRLNVRGVYGNGLLGKGLPGLLEDIKDAGVSKENKKWLIITKGIGFAPAVNLIDNVRDHIKIDIITDTEKVNEEIIEDYLKSELAGHSSVEIFSASLQSMTEKLVSERARGRYCTLGGRYNADMYDRVILMTSDYYIKTLAENMEVPDHKLVFCNNFKMCCGEGICGACGHIDCKGNVNKMCKCRNVDVRELL